MSYKQLSHNVHASVVVLQRSLPGDAPLVVPPSADSSGVGAGKSAKTRSEKHAKKQKQSKKAKKSKKDKKAKPAKVSLEKEGKRCARRAQVSHPGVHSHSVRCCLVLILPTPLWTSGHPVHPSCTEHFQRHLLWGSTPRPSQM